MPARIDRALVKAVLAERLAEQLDGSAVAYVRSSDRPAEGTDAWAQIVAVDLTPDSRPKRSAENATASFTVTINVAVGASQDNEHAIDGALSLVAAVFDEWVSDATSTQYLDLERAVTAADTQPFEHAGIRTGVVQVEGRVQRSSGLTQTTYLT